MSRIDCRRLDCVVPLTVRLRGRPDAAALAELAAAVERQVRARLALAEAEIGRRLAAPAEDGDREIVREPFDVERWEVRAGGYRIPSYDGGGAPKTVRLDGPLPKGPVERIEIHLVVRRLLVFFKGRAAPLVFRLTKDPQLPPGETLRWAFRGEKHRVSTGTGNDVVVHFNGFESEKEAFKRGLPSDTDGVPAAVVPGLAHAGGSGGQQPGGPPTAGGGERRGGPPAAPGGKPGGKRRAGPPAAPGDKSSGKPGGEGERASPLRGDLGLLVDQPELAALFLDLLQRFAGVDVSSARAALGGAGLSEKEVEALIGNSEAARAVALFFTQGWKEYTDSGESEVLGFGALEQTILTQRQRGNFNALRNRLEIKSDREGPGIFLRGTPIRLYDAFGQPVRGIGGGFVDEGFLAFEPPQAAIRIKIRNRAVFQVLRAAQQTTVDQAAIAYQAVQGYIDNSDLLWPRVRNGWDVWDDIDEEMRRQLPGLVAFLALHLVALVLKRSNSPYGLLVGAGLETALATAGRAFQIVFVGSLLVLALQAGRELSLVERDESGRLDPLSRRHLDNAVGLTRRLLAAAFAAGLTATGLRAARETAITLTPSGGGSGPTPAPAVVAVGAGPRGTSPATGSPAPAAAAAGPPPRVPLPPAAVVPQPLQMSGSSDRGSRPVSGRRSGRRTGRRIVVKPREIPEQSPQQSAGKGPSEPAPRQQKPRDRPLTGRELERTLIAQHKATRAPDSARNFSRTNITMSRFVKELRAHLREQRRQGNQTAVGPIHDSILRQSAARVIRENPRLNATWERWQRQVAQELSKLARLRRQAAGDRATQRAIDRRIEQQEKRQKELDRFERGRVSRKEMDIIELNLDQKSAVISDPTLRTFDPQHNFKTRFYVEVIKSLLGWTKVEGNDLRSGMVQQPIQ